MPRFPRLRQALQWSACFACLTGFWSGTAEVAAAKAPCGPSHIDHQARVAYVYDGDTIRLVDGRKLRLIGVNTPERARDGQAGQPLAETAWAFVKQRLKKQAKISLRYGIERHDRHGRTLAHVFLENGDNLTRLLLQQGYGLALTVPPNLALLDCYQQAEQTARNTQRGVWGHAYFSPRSAAHLTKSDTGFRRVGGVVSHLSEYRGNVWLRLSPTFSLFIRGPDRVYFAKLSASNWVGQNLVARGWLRRHRGQWQLTLRHPAALENITQTQP